MRSVRIEMLFYITLGILVMGMVWSVVDMPLDSGERLHGTVVSCAGRGRVRRMCEVRLDDGENVVLEAPAGEVAERVVVAVSTRRLTHYRYLTVVQYAVP